jgi:hypothetical protein
MICPKCRNYLLGVNQHHKDCPNCGAQMVGLYGVPRRPRAPESKRYQKKYARGSAGCSR